MKHIVTGIIYRNAFGDGEWYDAAIVPGTATLDIAQEWNDHGPLLTYSLGATVRPLRRIGESSLDQPLCLIVSLDDGSKVRVGTPALPCRVETTLSETLRISCSWECPALP